MTAARAEPSDIAVRLVEIAARLLDEGGESAVTARRVTSEAGVSTIAVYTHFGSMDGLIAAVLREGFARFGEELERRAVTKDPVADFMAQGWGYRDFSLREPHLYNVMFGMGLRVRLMAPMHEPDAAAATATFQSLVTGLQRAADAGRFSFDDPVVAAHVIWSTVHGHCSLEHTGSFGRTGIDPVHAYGEGLLRIAIGFGDEREAAQRSLARSRTRARRIGQLSP